VLYRFRGGWMCSIVSVRQFIRKQEISHEKQNNNFEGR
jgi:hypothetical protein